MKRTHFSILILFLTLTVSCVTGTNSVIPNVGIYDGNIGGKKLILLIEESMETNASGYFVYNGKNAVEDLVAFEIKFDDNQLAFVSPDFNGNIEAELTDNGFTGKLHQKVSIFQFWKRKRKFQFVKREIEQIRTITRYKEEIFEDLLIEKDLVYGNAKGYWTETPYLDDPYIEILGRGMVNLFKGEKELDLKLDIYQPSADTHNLRPLILFVHGGGFYIGNKQSATGKIFATHFTKLGYVVASMDYRMGFRMKASEIERTGYKAIQDVHAALRYLSNRANDYKIDPNQIYLAGSSAGAIASLNTAYLDNNERPQSTYEIKKKPDLGPIESSGNKYNNEFQIKSVVNMWGAVSDIEIIDQNEDIPVISFHGDDDKIVPFGNDYPFKNTLRVNRLVMEKMYGSDPIHKRLDNHGVDNRLVVFDGKGHEPQLDNFNNINDLMYVILNESTDFLYDQTASKITLTNSELIVNETDRLKPIQLKISNGQIEHLVVTGGIKASTDRTDTRIIWFKGAPVHKVAIYSNNQYDAWNKVTIPVKLK